MSKSKVRKSAVWLYLFRTDLFYPVDVSREVALRYLRGGAKAVMKFLVRTIAQYMGLTEFSVKWAYVWDMKKEKIILLRARLGGQEGDTVLIVLPEETDDFHVLSDLVARAREIVVIYP